MRRAAGGSRDPGHVALRHAARVTCVGLVVFVGLGWGLDRPDAAGPAMFAVYTLGAQADFSGSPGRRTLRYLLTGCVGLAMFPLAAAFTDWPAAVVALTGVVVFTTLFLGTLGGPFFAARFPVVIAYLYAATTAFGGDLLAQRMLGWAVGTIAITLGALVLWPTRAASPVPALTAEVCRRAAAVLGAPAARDPERAGLLQASHELRVEAMRAHLHPGAVAIDERRWSELVHCAERLAAACAVLAPVPADPADPNDPADRALTTAMTSGLTGSASLLDGARAGAGPNLPIATRVQAALDTHAVCMADAVARPVSTHAPNTADTPGAAPDGAAIPDPVHALADATALRIVARLVIVVGALVDEICTGVPAPAVGIGTADEVGDRPDAALAAQLHLRSLWLRNALRAAAALMVAVALVLAGTGRDHGFWIALGAFSVLRADLGTIGRSARSVVIGTAVGFVVSSLLVLVAGDATGVLWVAFPLALFCSVAGDRLRPEFGSAAFTVMLVSMVTLIEPAGLHTGQVRLVNVTLGAAITLAVGLLLWPHTGRAPRHLVAAVVDDARAALAAAIAREPVPVTLGLVTDLDRVLDVVATSAPRAFTDDLRARVLLIVDLTATTAELLAHPSPRVPVPLAAAARAPELRDALTVDGASVDAALTGFVARLDHRPVLPAPEPPGRVAQVVTTALAADPPPAPDVASAGIRMAAVLASLYRLADAPAAQTPTATGTLE